MPSGLADCRPISKGWAFPAEASAAMTVAANLSTYRSGETPGLAPVAGVAEGDRR